MEITNEKVLSHNFLVGMYKDGYFPDILVDKIKIILLDVCRKIEVANPKTHEEVYAITHPAVELINDLEEEFEEHESELETVAREVMAADFDHIVQSYGFMDIDLEEVIAPRDW